MNLKGKILFLIYSIIAWQFLIGFFLLMRFYGIEDYSFIEFSQKVPPNLIAILLQVSLMEGMIVGAIFGTIHLTIESFDFFKKKPYGYLILLRSTLTLFITALLVYQFPIVAQRLIAPEYIPDTAGFGERFFSRPTMTLLGYVALTSILYNFILQINQKLGPGTIVKLITGKYHHPIEEDRVFMFLDLRSSTTIAEKLGPYQYSELIQDCFWDLTDSVIKYKAEIYQYVGDEVVLTWKTKSGIKDKNCIRLFFDFRRRLEANSSHYQQKYGIVPVFKAGVSSGKAVITEVGLIKREICFHGDVLNTAARIQARCNEVGKDLLISHLILEKVDKDAEFSFELIGEEILRGKEEKVKLFGVDRVKSTD